MSYINHRRRKLLNIGRGAYPARPISILGGGGGGGGGVCVWGGGGVLQNVHTRMHAHISMYERMYMLLNFHP